MKIIRRILLLVLLLVLLLIGIGFILPGNVRIERSIIISASKEMIYNQVNNIQKWRLWSPLLMMDSSMIVEYSGPEKGKGAVIAYQSLNSSIGGGRIMITGSYPYDSIVLDMNFGDNGNTTEKFILTEVDSGTRVSLIMESMLGINPVSRWFGLFADKMAGNDLEQGLANLEELVSQLPATPIIAVVEKEIPVRIVLSMRDTATPFTFADKLTDYYSRISEVIKKKKLKISGVPFSVFHSYTPELFDVEIGIPVDKLIPLNGDVKSQVYPATRVAMASYFGPYESTAVVYEAIEKYMKDKSLVASGGPWEEYITDPANEPDTSKWQTDIFYPIK